MDSLSQVALGATVAQVALGNRIGRRAMLVGAVLGTVPDLDVLVPYADAVDGFTRHRGVSHSLFVLCLASAPLAFASRAAWPWLAVRVGAARWWFAVWAILVTHPLLDAFTVYGTQLFWPLPVPPVAIGSVFIIDPLYTVPLLIGLALAWRRPPGRSRQVASLAGLSVSSAWLLATLVLQQVALHGARLGFEARGIVPQRQLALPLPGGVLWRILAIRDDKVFEGWVSVLDAEPMPAPARAPVGMDALGEARSLAVVQRLSWFTHSFVAARELDDRLVLTDLRMGTLTNPVFAFDTAEVVCDDVSGDGGPRYRARLAEARDPLIDPDEFRQLLRRATDPTVALAASGPLGALPGAGACAAAPPRDG